MVDQAMHGGASLSGEGKIADGVERGVRVCGCWLGRTWSEGRGRDKCKVVFVK